MSRNFTLTDAENARDRLRDLLRGDMHAFLAHERRAFVRALARLEKTVERIEAAEALLDGRVSA